ncbi:hypothetical protein EDC04DRAFT_2676662 [Pisolithus marmoratus]|nr:hypothetical protein EDC04DRAFT_2676662 [Pisolithus marmoratus]
MIVIEMASSGTVILPMFCHGLSWVLTQSSLAQLLLLCTYHTGMASTNCYKPTDATSSTLNELTSRPCQNQAQHLPWPCGTSLACISCTRPVSRAKQPRTQQDVV